MWLERNRDLKSLKKLDRKYIAMINNKRTGRIEFIFNALGEGFSEEYIYEGTQAKAWVYLGDHDYVDPTMSTQELVDYAKKFPSECYVFENPEDIAKGRAHIHERCNVYL